MDRFKLRIERFKFSIQLVNPERVKKDKKDKKVRLGVSICLDVVSIETLDLDTEKKSVSTVEKISTV